jgi:PAS domain S-box-containing protein
MPEHVTISRITSLLKIRPKGLTITEISSQLNMNRNSVAKYLEILLISGHVEAQLYGNTRVFFSTHRIPVSAMVGISSDLIMDLNEHHEVMFTNENFNNFFSLKKQDVVGCHLANLPVERDSPLPAIFSDVIARQDAACEARIEKNRVVFHFRIRGMKIVFDDGGQGIAITMEDVTREKEDQIRLAASEARYRAVIDAQTDLICRRKPDGTITFVNNEYLQFFKKTAAEVVGSLFCPLDLQLTGAGGSGDISFRIQPFYQDIYEQCVLHDRGGICWLQWKNTLITDPAGTVEEIQSVGRDITLQRIREREIILKQCSIESSGHAMILFDIIGRIVYANRSFLALFGCPDDCSVIGMPIEEFVSLSGPAMNINQLARILMQNGYVDFFFKGKRADTTEIDLEFHGILVKGDLNLPLMSLALFTTRSGASHHGNGVANEPAGIGTERSSQKSLLNVDPLSDLLLVPMFMIDADRKVLFWNSAMEAFSGIRSSDVLGKTTHHLMFSACPGLKPLLIDMISQPIDTIRQVFPDVRKYGDTIILEREIPGGKTGEKTYFYEKASILFDPSGTTIGYLEGFLNITNWKHSQEFMNHMKDEIDRYLHPHIRYLEEKIGRVPQPAAAGKL